MRAIFQQRTDYILDGATMSGTPPMTSYSLSTFLGMNPAARVRWSTGTVTITFTLPSPKRGDLLALPVSNCDVGASVVKVTNGAGLDEAITIPAMPLDKIPLTAMLDLAAAEPNASTRTSNVWNVVITANSVNVTMGGLIWIGNTLRTFDRNFVWRGRIQEEHLGEETINQYGSDYCVDHNTRRRWIDCQFANATDADAAALQAFYRANHGRWNVGLLWPDPTVNDGLVGRWQRVYSEEFTFINLKSVPLTFDERSKGKPVA